MAGISEEILIRFKGQDQTKSASNSVKKNIKDVDQTAKTTGKSLKGLSSSINSALGFMGGMIGYELISGLSEAGSQAINASQQFDYFAGRLNKSAEDTQAFRNEVKGMQKDFKKVNMEAVGATSMDIALRNGMKGTNEELSEITKMSATMASEFLRNGRTQEDSILAVNDALDGQFRRLQEIGISQDDLKNNGWNGDLNDKLGLVKALNETMKQMGYDKTAKDITNLDDAWAALTVSGGNLLKEVLLPMMPAFLSIIDGLTNLVSGFSEMPQEWKNFISYAIAGTGAVLVFAKALGGIKGALGGLKGFSGIFGKIFSTGGAAAGGAAGSEASGKGIVATLKGLKGFGKALLSLVPDILMAAAAVAVIIAVLFALAAEVILLTKGIQMLIDAMDFGGIDLTDDIDGLKKLKDAMKEIAEIMGAMAISNVANIVVTFTGGVLNLKESLGEIVDAYDEVASALQDLNKLGDLDQGGLDKLKKMGEAMKAIGDSVSGLNQLSGGINFGNAINDFVAWLTGGEADPAKNIDNVITKINEIAPKLDALKNLPDIDASGVEKIKKIGDAMKSLSDAMSGMQGYSGGVLGGIMDWWSGDLTAQVDKAVTQINQVGQKLQGVGTYTIPDMSWVQRAATGMQYLKGAMDVMSGYAGMQINTEVPELIGRAVTAVRMVAQQLQGLQGAQVGDVNSILSSIQTAIQQMKDTLAAANFTAEGTNIGQSLTTGVQSGLSGLSGVVSDASSQAVSAAEGVFPSGMGNVATSAVNAFRDNLKLADIASAEMSYAVQAINNGSGALAQAAAAAASKAVQAAQDAAGVGSPGYIARMWGTEFGKYSPQKIYQGAQNLINAARIVSQNVVRAFGEPNLGFNTDTGLLNRINSMNTGYATAPVEGMGNTYYVGEGAFNIHVSSMTDQECKSVILQALESL